jgi:hypothetical protein
MTQANPLAIVAARRALFDLALAIDAAKDTLSGEASVAAECAVASWHIVLDEVDPDGPRL